MKRHPFDARCLLLAAAMPFAAMAAEEPDPVTPADTAAETGVVPGNIPVTPDETAQAPLDAEAGNPGIRNRMVEEVVVTAQKREERIQDVPISIQAFSGDALAARGVENTKDLGPAIPSLQFTNVAGFTLIFIRGIGTDNFIPSADPSIATYVDGIYIPPTQGGANSLGNVQRVEVLKGPQGTLFGRNAVGGAISVITEEPGDQYKGDVEGAYGNFMERSVKGNVSGPVTDWLSASVSGLYSKQDSIYTNVNYAVQPDKQTGIRGKLNFHPLDDLTLSLTGYFSKYQSASGQVGNNTNPSLLGSAVGIMAQPDSYTGNSNSDAEAHSTQHVYYGILTYKLPAFDVKLLGSHEYILTDNAAFDFDGSSLPIAAFDVTSEYTRLNSGELQILSNDDTPWHEKLKWIAGLYYYHGTAGVDPARIQVASQAIQALTDIAANQAPSPVTSVLQTQVNSFFDQLDSIPGFDSGPLGQYGVSLLFRGLLATSSYSGYTQGTYYFTDWLDLTLGGRYQIEKRSLTKSETDLYNGLDNPTLIPFNLSSKTSNTFSPKAVLTAHPRENALIYASFGRSYKSGTYNIVNIYTPPTYIPPERVTTFELGSKIDFFGGLLRFNNALFYTQIKDLQSGSISLLSGGAVQFLSVPAARSYGAEFDATLLPLPELDSGFAITANGAYVNATYTDFPNGQGYDPTTGIYQQNQDYTGKRIVRTPRLSGSLALSQAVDVQTGSLEFVVDEYFNSGFYYDPGNTVEEHPYAILNAHASYLHTPWNLRITAFVQNVLDRQYHFIQFQSDFGIAKTLAPPREYGLRLNWEFQ